MYCFSEVILYFSIYSFLGWVCECIYCSIPAKKFINRGFLTGPVCPVYGFGALLVIWVLRPFAGSAVFVFLLGMVVTSALEYITSVVLERLFHMKWWDYSHYKFNIQGRVCLLNSILFGLLSTFVILVIHPPMVRMAQRIPTAAEYALGSILLVLFMVDTVISARTTLQLSGKLQQLHVVAEELRERTESYKQLLQKNLENKLENKLEKLRGVADLEEYRAELEQKRAAAAEHIERLKARVAELIRSDKLLHRRLIDAFPHLKSLRYENTIEKLREAIKDRQSNTHK